MKSGKVFAVGVKVALAVALVAGISAGCGGPSTKVEVERVGPRSIEETVMTAGSLLASSPTQVMPQVSGSVAQVYAQDGQDVAAGQALVQLDTSSLEQSLLSAEASLESMQSLAGVFNSLSASAGNLTGSISNAFESVLSRMDAGVAALYTLEQNLITLLPEEQRMSALQAVENSYKNYQASRSQPLPPVTPVEGGGYSTGAQEASASKAIANAQKNLKAATITAPAAGTLVSAVTGGLNLQSMMSSLMSSFGSMIPSGLNLSASTGMTSSFGSLGLPSGGPLVPGSFIMPGSPLFTIVDLKDMSMSAKVDESDIAKIQPGQRATVSLEAYPERSFPGRVVKVADTATTNEAGATAFEVTIKMDPTDISLKIGMSGSANLVVAEKRGVPVVPIEAVVEKKGKKYVFKVVDGKARLTKISVGITTEANAEILGGIKAGDRVVVKGTEKLQDGQGVKI
ncbi:MAG: efflux RND transporter periplasmic adaptor subunit [Actinobacteria bacterium]|nr:efflux RND transporter periplasmic adaptor subunit [Actinomycetota bacterium]